MTPRQEMRVAWTRVVAWKWRGMGGSGQIWAVELTGPAGLCGRLRIHKESRAAAGDGD